MADGSDQQANGSSHLGAKRRANLEASRLGGSAATLLARSESSRQRGLEADPDRLSDAALTSGITTLVASSRRLTALFLRYLAEIETRRLHLEAACSSVFVYCRDRLGLSEGEAFRRIVGARLGRRFPIIFEWVEQGRIHLSALTLLREHLDDDNHLELLGAAAGKTKRELEELLATRFPRPDVPARIRRLPARRQRGNACEIAGAEQAPATPQSPATPWWGSGVTAAAAQAGGEGAEAKVRTETTASGGAGTGAASPGATAATPWLGVAATSETLPGAETHTGDARDETAMPVDEAGEAGARSPGEPPLGGLGRIEPLRKTLGRIEPLSEARYRVELTASAAARDKLLRARDLMRHQNPSGDLAVVIERALDLLVADLEKKRLDKAQRPRDASARDGARGEPSMLARSKGGADQPRADTAAGGHAGAMAGVGERSDRTHGMRGRAAKEGGRAEYVRAAVRREVFARDGERCAFVDAQGRRCEERGWLQLDHARPRALGGYSETDNVRVLCRAHNLHAAERTFGCERVRARIHLRQRKCGAAEAAGKGWRGDTGGESRRP